MWVATGAAIVGVGTNILGGISANKKAKEAADQQAKLTYFQRMEEVRRQEKQFDHDKGLAKSAVAASGLTFSGSSKDYLTSMDMEYSRQVAHAKRAAQLEKRAIERGAAGAGAGFFAQAAGDALGLAANIYANRAVSTGSAYMPGPNTTITNRTSTGVGQQTSRGGWTIKG